MAIAYKSALTPVQSKASGSTLNATHPAIAAGDTILLGVVGNNIGSSGPTISSITTGAGETATWQLLKSYTSPTATSAAGTIGYLYAITATTAWSAGSKVITFSGSITAKVSVGLIFTGLDQTVVASGSNSSASTVTLDVTDRPSGGIAVALWGYEGPVPSTDGGPTSNPTEIGTTGGTAATNQSARMAWSSSAGLATMEVTGSSDQGMLFVTFDQAVATSWDASASQSIGSIGQSATATEAEPTFTGSASQPIGSIAQTASGSFSIPTRTASASQSIGSMGQSAAGSFSIPTRTASASQSIGTIGQTASASRTVPTFTGSATQQIGAVGQSASSSFSIPTRTASASQSIGSIGQSAGGSTTAPTFTGAAAQPIGPIGQSASASQAPPAFSASQSIGSIGQTASGSFSIPTRTASAAQPIGTIGQTAAGSQTPPTFTGSATQQIRSGFGQTASASSTIRTASASQAIGTIGQTAAGTHTKPTFTASAAQLISGGFLQTAVALVTKPAVEFPETRTVTAGSLLQPLERAPLTVPALGQRTLLSATPRGIQQIPMREIR